MAKSPMERIDTGVRKYREKYPAHNTEIDRFLESFLLPDGRLKHDDNIMIGLYSLSKQWKKPKCV